MALLVLAGCPGGAPPPDPVSSLEITASATTVSLAWAYPTERYGGAMVRRALGTTPPSSPTAGTLVVDMPWPDTTADDRGLSPSTTYSYAVFAHGWEADALSNYAPAATATVTTQPVNPVSGLDASATATEVTLTWTNPSQGPFTGTMVRRATGATPPASPTSGTLVGDVAAPGAMVTDSGRDPSTTYSYALFAHDGTPLYASGATVTVSTLAPPPTPSVLATGVAHSCALMTDGSVRCWGQNNYGQLGDGTTTNSSTPVTVVGISGATSLIAGYGYTCALLPTGEIKCWGSNINGQLGTGGYGSSISPVTVSGIADATAIAGDYSHTCAIVTGGVVKCWGLNNFAQLGGGTTSPSINLPVTVNGLTGATAVTTGAFHTCALIAGGSIRCWGGNANGALGNGTTTASPTPVTVTGITGATAITAGSGGGGVTGGGTTCALLGDGTLRCWGGNANGQLGNGTTTSATTPVTVTGITTATAVAAGWLHGCARLADSTERCWGYNAWGNLGNGTTTGTTTSVPVTGLTTALAIAADGYNSCALLAGGAVRCWGQNTWGQLGNGTTTSSSVPVTVVGL